MSTRKSTRNKKQPDRYTPTNKNDKSSLNDRNILGPETVNDEKLQTFNSHNSEHSGSKKSENEQKTVISEKTTSSAVSRRKRLQIELEKIEEINKLEKLHEEREFRRQREFEQKKMEFEQKELERQRLQETKELERQKRLIQAKSELESASVSSRSYYTRSKVGSSTNLEEEEEGSLSKVERWLCDEKPTVLPSPPAIESTAVLRLADTLRHALQPSSTNFQRQLPTFSGKPDEWPIFYFTYLKTANLFTEDDNLARVRNCLEGDAYKMVKPLFVSSKNLSTVIKTLQMRFGRPEFVIESMMNKTRMLLPVKEDDTTALLEFSSHILNLTSTAESLHLNNYLVNPTLLNELLCKLPFSLKYRWAEHVSSSNRNFDLNEFSNWLEKQCSIMSIYFRPPEHKSGAKKTAEFKQVFTNVSKDNYDKTSTGSCLFCKEKHETEKCKLLRKVDVPKRWEMVVEKRLCFNCFRSHQLKFCKVKKVCGINGCKLFHHRLLHTDKVEKTVSEEKPNTSGPKHEVNSNHVEDTLNARVLLRVCPVTLYGPNSKVDTYALLDDGSTVSLVDVAISEELGLKGEPDPLTTCWSNKSRHYDPTSRRVDVQIKGLYEDETFTLTNVRTQSPLDLPRQTVDTVKLRERWSHLSSINQPLPSASAKPTILIGQDNCNLILTRKVVEGPSNSPVLSWSRLGWSLHGNCPKYRERIDENFTLTSFECDRLHDIVKESFEIDNYGAEMKEDHKVNSVDEERAIKILEETTKKIEDRYESGLLWKTDKFKFPPSYDNALKRLKNIEVKMRKDSNFEKQYKQKIAEYLEKGYIRKLNEDESSVLRDRTFYLPHFGVVNPNKQNKLRLVFDAAAKSNGVSFNDALLSGPDFLNSLPSVLMKFRSGKFAIAGDIKEMFHQVRIKKDDADSQRFLWRENPRDKPDTYIMNVMIFGLTCSPSMALYVVNKNAEHFSSIYPDASKSILTKEYMDDLLDSTDSEEEAKRRIQEISEIHKYGGFQICNWLSNSHNVLLDIPEELKANSTKQLSPDNDLPTERVLGMWWEAETDNFVFYHNAEKIKSMESCYPTKREVLRAAMSIFDPLGLVVPTTIKGRMLVQDIWRTKITWDEVLPLNLTKKWQDWLEEVENIQFMKVPRCYFQTSRREKIELHIFVDASEEAYSAAAYLRQETLTDEDKPSYKTTLVCARSKVTPLKPITIPRLELQAAVLGCRLAHSVARDIDMNISKRVFWSDSVSVLHWIKSDPKTFKQFVANRIGDIQQLSKCEEWRWVPSKQNPADIATRSGRKFTSKAQEEWIGGPQFLTCDTSLWPEQPTSLQSTSNEEKKAQFVGLHDEAKEQLVRIEKFSSWEILTRVTAWVLRYIKNLKNRVESTIKKQLQVKEVDFSKFSEIQSVEIKEAEKIIIRMSQDISFEEEKILLAKNKPLPKSSRILSLSPFLDEDGMIRMLPRTCNSPDTSEDNKQPYILDGRSHTAKLIVKLNHIKCFHQGIETVINMTRERFWILNLRTLVKSVQRSCMRCRIDNAKPIPPQMAPLPETRVSRVEHPFYYTGIDYFGPIEVTVGRRHETRYGVLFTCMSTRAIHLEVAHSLDTKSCVMAIQRFVSRKPCPSEIFSDNGTNFVGTDKELRMAIKDLNQAQLQRSVTRHGIKWNFIPPRAPHMGGCWERLIRSVKTALRSVLKSQFPKDEELQTFLVQVEFIINSRPLTHVPIDPQDPDPITPNHFLREAFKFDFNEKELCKKQLARVRALLDCFWKRWVSEYLPCLSRRCKWHKRTDPPSVGDLAIIIEENSARNTWPLGRIAAIYPSKDGQVRIVDVETTVGTFRRPLTKVAVLSEGEKM